MTYQSKYVHQSRVQQCPELFLKGFTGMGVKDNGPGCPTKKVQKKPEQITAIICDPLPIDTNRDPIAEMIVTDDSDGEDS